MLRVACGLVCLAAAVPAAAEDWWLMDNLGDAPDRQVVMLDADSVDRTDPALPTIKMALAYEQADENGITASVVTYALECEPARLMPVFVDIRDSAGNVLDAQPVTGEPFEAIAPGTNYDLLRQTVCDGQWDWLGAVQLGEGKTPTQIANELFED